ncbi:hypothetical protein [Oceanobacillus sp. CAU 1775]
MNRNEEELIQKLKKLKLEQSIHPHQKEEMKMTIQKHAKKSSRSRKRKPLLISLAAVAVILIGSVLLYPMLSDFITAPPPENQEENQTSTSEENKETDDSTTIPSNEEVEENEPFQIVELGSEPSTIELEGMEEATTVYHYMIEPYGISYAIDAFLNHSYIVKNETVTYYPEYESVASVSLSVIENVEMEQVAEEMAQQFEAYEEVSDGEAFIDGNHDYPGWSQTALKPAEDGISSPIGYYLYQVGKNVLLIEYEYIAEAGDGMGPRLYMLIESIR